LPHMTCGAQQVSAVPAGAWPPTPLATSSSDGPIQTCSSRICPRMRSLMLGSTFPAHLINTIFPPKRRSCVQQSQRYRQLAAVLLSTAMPQCGASASEAAREMLFGQWASSSLAAPLLQQPRLQQSQRCLFSLHAVICSGYVCALFAFAGGRGYPSTDGYRDAYGQVRSHAAANMHHGALLCSNGPPAPA
jgi:hypothetical protein